MERLLDAGFIDTFRHLYPDRTDAYTWWSFMPKVRERNIGWRIDYFLVAARLADKVREATIESAIMGSDHCPVTLEIDLEW
jgi:exodeoxyribonuclease III (xth)